MFYKYHEYERAYFVYHIIGQEGSSMYSVDSIKRTVHLAFHGLFSLLKILFIISKQYF